MWCCYDDDDDELMMMMVMTAETAGGGGGKMARGGEWGSGLGRSEEEEHIWCSPEKSAGKVFRRRRRLSGGRRWPEKVGEGESDGRKRDCVERIPWASSSSAHPENDKDVSHLDDNMESDGQNAKDGYIDDPMLRTIKPKYDFDEADVLDSYDDDYISLFNDEEKPAKSCLNDLELQQEPDKVDVKDGILEQQPISDKEKTIVIKETVGVTVEEGPSLGRGLGTLKSKKKNYQRALRPNYVLRSAQIRKKKMAMSLKSPFGQQSDTTPVPIKRKTRLKKTDNIVLPFDLEDISGQPRIQSINHIMTHDPFVVNLSRLDGCKSDKVTVPEYMSAFITNKDLLEYWFPRGKRDIVIGRSFWLRLSCLNIGKSDWLTDQVYFLVNELKEHWCLAELEIRTRVVTFYDSLGWAGESRRRWWRRMKKVFPEKLTLYLLMHGIFDNKGISADDYKLTYNYASILFQASLYGDCGI
ncbi:phospholipase-like protein [Tanacetum coccineum]|uniref:Phospholipase-like protein n=1 Tax=Tanacetum coccineum TaxID=301880 RepID=A0ABQ5FSI3_9ASTR